MEQVVKSIMIAVDLLSLHKISSSDIFFFFLSLACGCGAFPVWSLTGTNTKQHDVKIYNLEYHCRSSLSQYNS